MFVRYLLYFVLLLSEFILVTLLIKHKCKKDRVLIWSVVVFITGFIMVSIMQNTYFMYDQYTITVHEETNPKATNNQVYLYTVSQGNREINQMKIVDGHWVDDGEFLVYDKNYYGITKDIIIDVPVGMSREIIFSTGDSCGIISVNSEKQEFYQKIDLYSENVGSSEIPIPASSDKSLSANRLIRIILFCILLGFVEAVTYYVIIIIDKGKVLVSTKAKYAWVLGIGFTVLFLVYGWTPADEVYSSYPNLYYFENYELGFLSRGFVGQILCEISAYWSVLDLYFLKVFLTSILVLIICVSASNVLARRFDVKTAYLVMFFLLFTPVTGVLFTDRLRADICFLIMYLLAVLVINKSGYLLAYLPLLCVLIILINETTCLTIIPSVLALVLYKYVLTEEKTYKLSLILSLIASVVTAVVTTVYGKGGKVSLEETFVNISSHYGGVLAQPALNAEYYELSEHLALAYRKYLEHWNEYLAFILVTIPILYLIGCFYMAAYRKIVRQTTKNLKMAFGLLAIVAFSPISAMLIAVDFGRYSLIIFVILMVNFFSVINQEKTIFTIEDIYLFNEPQKEGNIFPFVIVIFLAKLSPFFPVATDSVPYISSWIEYFENLL